MYQIITVGKDEGKLFFTQENYSHENGSNEKRLRHCHQERVLGCSWMGHAKSIRDTNTCKALESNHQSIISWSIEKNIWKLYNQNQHLIRSYFILNFNIILFRIKVLMPMIIMCQLRVNSFVM